jgi:hypothetical protein
VNIVLWVLQVCLAGVLILQGVAGLYWMIARWRGGRAASRFADGVSQSIWGAPGPLWYVRLDAVVSLVVGVLVIIPWATGWYPILTPLAAAVLVVFNLVQRATPWGRMHAGNLVLTGLAAALVAVGRFWGLTA